MSAAGPVRGEIRKPRRTAELIPPGPPVTFGTRGAFLAAGGEASGGPVARPAPTQAAPPGGVLLLLCTHQAMSQGLLVVLLLVEGAEVWVIFAHVSALRQLRYPV